MRKPGARVLAFLLCLCMIVPQQTGVAAGAEINNKISLAYGEPDVPVESWDHLLTLSTCSHDDRLA